GRWCPAPATSSSAQSISSTMQCSSRRQRVHWALVSALRALMDHRCETVIRMERGATARPTIASVRFSFSVCFFQLKLLFYFVAFCCFLLFCVAFCCLLLVFVSLLLLLLLFLGLTCPAEEALNA